MMTGTEKHRLIAAYENSLPEPCPFSTTIHDRDFLFQFVMSHPGFSAPLDAIRYYFNDGQRSAKMLADLLFNDLDLKPDAGMSLLEFASGYGCVTRHLKQQLEGVKIVSSDIHPAANEFNAKQFAVDTIQSTRAPEDYPAESKFDIVFVLSFFSHMPRHTWGDWLEKLYSLIKQDGYLLLTTHGLKSRVHFGNPEIPDDGFWFCADESEQKDIDLNEYGQTIVLREFVDREVNRRLLKDVSIYKEGFWWMHQDLYVIRKTFL